MREDHAAEHPDRGYAFEHKTASVLFGLGFGEDDLEKPFRNLSSGQRTRAELAKLLLREPDLLLWDEPGNHLDIAAQEWLEEYIAHYERAALIVSHDRTFLDRAVSRIFELRRGKLTEYVGGYSAYAAQRALWERQAWDETKRKRKEEKRLRRAVAERMRVARKVVRRPPTYDPYHKPFYKAKAAKVQKRAKGIERRAQKIQTTIEKPFVEKKVRIAFPEVRRSSDTVLAVRNLSKSFGPHWLFHDLNFDLTRGERMAIIGPNGSGKTTLLRILLGKVRADTGHVHLGHHVRIGYYTQEHEDLDLDRTILQEVLSIGNADETWARTVLGALMLRKEKVYDRIRNLSLGERGRVVLTKLLVSGANLLVLDEPMNHLDIDARKAVEQALEEYPGTILFVSHDRPFIERIADEIVEHEDAQALAQPEVRSGKRPRNSRKGSSGQGDCFAACSTSSKPS